jgi:hypothetical protein
MFDYELFAPDDATMQNVLTQMSMRQANSGKVEGTVYATDYYGTKYVTSGVSPNFVYTAQPGVYCNIRWMGQTVLTLNQTMINAGCKLVLLIAPIYRQFAPVG